MADNLKAERDFGRCADCQRRNVGIITLFGIIN
ncbi:Uncharacterised protein [Vibrio cholerae]|nr:Uncharacterised protein [Vibrio cholerae]CSI63874.1 Uncharacterised protein [Vibrio cholerae]